MSNKKRISKKRAELIAKAPRYYYFDIETRVDYGNGPDYSATVIAYKGMDNHIHLLEL